MAIYEARVEQHSAEADTTSAKRSSVVRLQARTLFRTKRHAEVIRVTSGSAWITFDGQDWFVYSGEEFTLTPGKDDAVIESLDENPLVFAITA